MVKSNLVYPGSYLANEEEFMAGENAFEDNEGSVFADSVGVENLDSTSHEASVEKKSPNAKIVEKGSVVYGVVSSIKNSAVLVDLKLAEKDGEKRVVHNRNASIPIFNIADAYVKSAEDFFRVGDIVKARVIQVTPYGVDLETKSEDLGVVKAFAIRGRTPLVLIGTSLRDPVTGETESRKISSDYWLR